MSRLEDAEEGWMARALNKPAKSLAEGMTRGPTAPFAPIPMTQETINPKPVVRTLVYQTTLRKKHTTAQAGDRLLILRVVRANIGHAEGVAAPSGGYELYVVLTEVGIAPKMLSLMASGTAPEIASCHDAKIIMEAENGFYVDTGGKIAGDSHNVLSCAKELFWTPPEMWKPQQQGKPGKPLPPNPTNWQTMPPEVAPTAPRPVQLPLNTARRITFEDGE